MSLSHYFNTEVCTVIRTERIAEHLVGKTEQVIARTTIHNNNGQHHKEKYSNNTTPQIFQGCAFQEWTASGGM